MLRRLLLLTLVCVLLALSAAAWSQAPGKPLGDKPSGIINEQNAKVGSGPPLHLQAPGARAPEEEEGEVEDTPHDRFVRAVAWLRAFLKTYNLLEKEHAKIRMALRVGAIEIAELRQELRDSRAHLADLEAHTELESYPHHADNIAFWKDRIAEKEDDLGKVMREQDKLITGMKGLWEDSAQMLSDKIAETTDFPEFSKTLTDLQGRMDKRGQLAEMELYLSAGQSEEFRKLANAARDSDDPNVQAQLLLMRTSDYIQQGEGRNALYAARLGMDRFKGQPTYQAFAEMASGLESTYLRSFAAKTQRDRADLDAAWSDFARLGDKNAIWGFLTAGMTAGCQAAVGLPDAFERMTSNGADRAAMEKNGMALMARLHQNGYSFEQMRAMSTDELNLTLTDIFNPTQELGDKSVRMLGLCMHAAFQNDDVKRLMQPNKEQFDLDMQRSAYGAQDFEIMQAANDEGFLTSFGKHVGMGIADSASIGNAVLFFGPNAVLQYGTAEAGWAARLSRIGVSEKMIGTAVDGEVTIRDWLLARPTLQGVADCFGTSEERAVLTKCINGLRWARYDAPGVAGGALQLATGFSEAMGQLVLFEAGGALGKQVGGDVGAFLAQAAVMLAGSPLGDAQKAYQANAKTLAKAAHADAAVVQDAAATAEKLDKVEATVDPLVEKVAEGKPLEAGETAELDQAAADAKAARMRELQQAFEKNEAVIMTAEERAQLLEDAATAAKDGKVEAAEMSRDLAKERGVAVEEGAGTIKVEQQQLQKAADDARAPTTDEPAFEPPDDKGTTPVPKDPKTLPEPPPKPELPPTAAEADKLGNEAMLERDYEAAGRHFSAGLEDPKLTPEEGERLKQALKEAEDAKRATETAPSPESPRYKQAVEREKVALEDIKADELEKLKTETKYEHWEPMVDDKGQPIESASAPRVLKNAAGERVFLWKRAELPEVLRNGPMEGLDDMAQKVAEIICSRIGRWLGLRVPAAAPLDLVDASGTVRKGVVMRFVEGTRNFESLTPGERAALSEQIARFRPLQIFVGQHDIHMRNWLVDEAGHVWAIDFGGAALCNHGSFAGESQELMMQVARDLYCLQVRPGVPRMEELLRLDDMEQVANKLEFVGGAKIDEFVTRDLPDLPQAEVEHIKGNLTERKRVLTTLLDKYKKAPPAAPQATPETKAPAASTDAWVVPLPRHARRALPDALAPAA